MAKHVCECTLTIEDKTFVNADKQNVDYTACTLTINGEQVRVSVKKEDKSLLNYLRRDMCEA